MKVKKIITVTKSVDFDIVSATLLTVEEAKQLPQEILTAARDSWWLRSPGDEARYAACIFGEHIHGDGEYVDMKLGVRPAIIFKSSELEVGDKFKAFDYEWTVISPNMALCNNVIGRSPFRIEWQFADANVYEKSDIKKYVDNWFTYNCYERKEINEGEWIVHYNDIFPVESTEECSICHAEQYINGNDDNYCPNCGAKMKQAEKG